MGSCTDPIGSACAELLQWHKPAAGDMPDCDLMVLLWVQDGGVADWCGGWFDGTDWRLAESGGVCAGVVLAWAEPEGPPVTLPAEPLRCPEDGGLCGAGGYCRPEPLDVDALVRAQDAEIQRLRLLTFCGCGDQFSAHDPGTCGNCCASMQSVQPDEIERLRAELLCAREDAKKWQGLAEIARELANLKNRNPLGPNVELTGRTRSG